MKNIHFRFSTHTTFLSIWDTLIPDFLHTHYTSNILCTTSISLLDKLFPAWDALQRKFQIFYTHSCLRCTSIYTPFLYLTYFKYISLSFLLQHFFDTLSLPLPQIKHTSTSVSQVFIPKKKKQFVLRYLVVII